MLAYLLSIEVTMIYQAVRKTQKEVIVPFSLIWLVVRSVLLCDWAKHPTSLDLAAFLPLMEASKIVFINFILNIREMAFLNLLGFRICILRVDWLKCSLVMRIVCHSLCKLLCQKNVYNHIPVYVFRHALHSLFNLFVCEGHITWVLVVVVPWHQWQQVLDLL